MLVAMTSGSKNGIDHPPCWKPPSVSSSRPPGACTTPSRLMNSLITIRIWIRRLHNRQLIACEDAGMDYSRLSMPLGEAMFTQRSIRRFRPDPVPVEDIRLIIEAAVRAPNGGNMQPGRFLVVNDAAAIKEFGPLYREAWWAKRNDE